MKHPHATGALSQLLTNLMSAIKACSYAVRRAGISELYGLAGTTNVTGDSQKKLDVIANELMINMLKSSYCTAAMISEENEELIIVDDYERGNYVVAFDPLDGSSNIDCLGTIGTIFAVWKLKNANDLSLNSILQAGNEMICSGYAIYGSATVVVLAVSNDVHSFTLDPSIGEFLLTEKRMKIPETGRIYSINEGYAKYWDNVVKEYVGNKKNPQVGEPYTSRYVGSMVADIHRTLKYGGIFMYPATCKNPRGKLRLLYEAFPMAKIIHNAGGAASDGHIPILDIIPTEIHQKTPVFIGSAKEVKEIVDLYKRS